MVKNRKCLCDGTAYSYCPDCSRTDKLAPSWKAEFCSETCMTLWTTLTKFGMNRITKAEAKSIISELNLKPIDAYVECVRRDYAKVMEAEKKSRRAQRKFEPVVETEQIEQPEEVAEAHEVVLKENE